MILRKNKNYNPRQGGQKNLSSEGKDEPRDARTQKSGQTSSGADIEASQKKPYFQTDIEVYSKFGIQCGDSYIRGTV